MSFSDAFEPKFRAAQDQIARKPAGKESDVRRPRKHARQANNGDGANEFPRDAKNDINAEISRLAKLSIFEYERVRKDAAKNLMVRADILDKLVAAARPQSGDDGKQGRKVQLVEPEPWPQPINGAEVLADVSAAISRHVVMEKWQADTTALWVAHTHLLDCFAISPRLAITSPEKGCGKTTLLDVLSRPVLRPLPTTNVTAAAIYRVVEAHRPTLLIDEADTFLSVRDDLRGILNSGHRQNAFVLRTVGDEFEPRQFCTYAACAIALIGKLPDTLADRSVHIELRRRRADEPVEPFRLDRTEHLDNLARKLARWARDNAERIRSAEPDMPAGVFNRVADNWRPLLAIADVAGGDWPRRGQHAPQCAHANGSDDDDSMKVRLLSDIRAIFDERKADKLSSADLVTSLIAIEGRPWAEWKASKPLTQNSLARLLSPFKISSDSVRIGEHTPKGYCRAQFEDAFARYLSSVGS